MNTYELIKVKCGLCLKIKSIVLQCDYCIWTAPWKLSCHDIFCNYMKSNFVFSLLKFQSGSSRVTCISLRAIATFGLTAHPPFHFQCSGTKGGLEELQHVFKDYIFTGLNCEPPQFTSSEQDTKTWMPLTLW